MLFLKIQLNSKEKILTKEYTLSSLIGELELLDEHVAIELNFKLINRSDYATTQINEGDKIELIQMLGGG